MGPTHKTAVHKAIDLALVIFLTADGGKSYEKLG